jgi:uncharacterized delta-60 repeat protein
MVMAAASTAAMAQAGHLDKTFANHGIFSDSFSGGTNFATVVALQSDGKILVGGQTGDSVASVIRLNTNGTLDTSFGTAGVVQLKFRVVDNFVTGLAVQPDGKIVVSGTGIPGGGALDRLNSDGSLDSSFGNNGSVFIFPMNPGQLVLQTDGKIVLVGTSPLSLNPTVFAMQRFNSNGQLDTTFGSGGTAPLLNPGAIVLQPDGKFLVAALDRYNNNGSLDTSFGVRGQVATLSGGAIALQANGQIITAGSFVDKLSLAGSVAGFGLERINSDGSTDASFGTRGVAFTNFPNAPQTGAAAVAIQSNSDIVTAGEAGTAGNQPTQTFALARYLSTGQLDATFGNGGRVTTGFGNGVVAAISAMVIQADGKIVVVGNSGQSSWEVARYLAQ